MKQNLVFLLLFSSFALWQSCNSDDNANASRNANKTANAEMVDQAKNSNAASKDKAIQNSNANEDKGAQGQQQSPPIWDREGIPPTRKEQNDNSKNSNGNPGKKSNTNGTP